MKRLLILSGFEANGFAGLTRDLQLCHALNIKPYAIATTLTAQNDLGILAASAVESVTIRLQLESLIEPVEVIKIGLLPNRDVAQTIAQWIKVQPQKITVILDPVNLNSGNDLPFSAQPLLETIEPLLPYLTLITPNHDELAVLAETNAENAEQQLADFYKNNPTFSGQVLLTGGHEAEDSSGIITDRLFGYCQGELTAVESWQQTRLAISMRGTGCFLSSAIACAIACAYAINDAITLANAKMHQQFQHKLVANQDETLTPHWPTSLNHYPTVATQREATQFLPLQKRHGLYPVVDSVDWLKRMALVGVKTLQLRIKNQSQSQLREQIIEAVKLQKQFDLQLFINDYWQLAIELNAYGVHLGQEDICEANLSAIEQAGLRLGISTHGDTEFLRAAQIKPSYLAVGAIFPTRTKDMTGKIQGLDRLNRYCTMMTDIPIVAIGGITHDNIDSVLSAKPDFVAVVTAITEAKKPELVAQQFMAALDETPAKFERREEKTELD